MDPVFCAWLVVQANYTRIAEVCNIWRNYRDIEDSWEIVLQIMNYFGNQSSNFSAVAHPGAFNDPDMVSVRLVSES